MKMPFSASVYHYGGAPNGELSRRVDGLFGSGIYASCELLSSETPIRLTANFENPYYITVPSNYDEPPNKYPALDLLERFFDSDQINEMIDDYGGFGDQLIPLMTDKGHDGLVVKWPDGEVMVVAFNESKFGRITPKLAI